MAHIEQRLLTSQSAELRLKHNVRLIARALRAWAQRRRELAEALRGWMWKRRQHVSGWLPVRRAQLWRRRYVYVRGGPAQGSNPRRGRTGSFSSW